LQLRLGRTLLLRRAHGIDAIAHATIELHLGEVGVGLGGIPRPGAHLHDPALRHHRQPCAAGAEAELTPYLGSAGPRHVHVVRRA
jgi:hypothetical protein